MEDALEPLRRSTPARLFVGRAGPAYRTATYLELRRDHAFARDAVAAELAAWPAGFAERFGLFAVDSMAPDRRTHLLRPDLGRRLSEDARRRIAAECPSGATVQVALSDGLSATALAAQAPGLLPALAEQAAARGWTFGRPFLVRLGRVGLLNEIGDLLRPTVGVLLVGERPGLATHDSLSAYLAHRPATGQTDADRNLVANIHAGGVPPAVAAARIADLIARMIAAGHGGVAIKEGGPPAPERIGSPGEPGHSGTA